MKGLKIENGDVVREQGRPIVLEGLEYYSQRIKHAILLSLGESAYDTLSGIDWFTIFSSKVSTDRVLFEIRRIILKDPETVSLENIEVVEAEGKSRGIYIRFSANTIYGNVTEEI
ncbi:DUF2634 domain-containing protein [Leptospira yasudae]|uniref:DUF2634 domain-containing protein n=1 Tax=Leptospira yasudae TaxID=2202201 RepID=UPI001082B396|nr:DUF2634 domain-containing protein [Leptospira yasudae]TGK24265.1 DUF2634 domain-containing protein [Leptospira yasudae]TGM00877.1 DUF2634 domain-containing protein [Leptospira yasudae]